MNLWRTGFLLGLRGLTVWLTLPDYFYTGHSTVLDGIPFNAGWSQGLGFVILHVQWVREPT